jgi:hypothetical protein
MCLRKHRCAYDQDGERNEGYEWYWDTSYLTFFYFVV